LLGAFGGAVQGAWSDESLRLPAIMTFLVAASGTTFFGIGAAFWALVAGVGVAGVQRFSAAGSRRR
jgi:benzoate membrane transport protein